MTPEDEVPPVGADLWEVRAEAEEIAPVGGEQPKPRISRSKIGRRGSGPMDLAREYAALLKLSVRGIAVSIDDQRQIAAHYKRLRDEGWTPAMYRSLLRLYFDNADMVRSLSSGGSHVTLFRQRAKALQGRVVWEQTEEARREAALSSSWIAPDGTDLRTVRNPYTGQPAWGEESP